ncbi:NEDD4-binding protein 2-like 2 [Geodia barretti]|uniref:NEDD4-binding protein 2-like 2 n=1 Tax=Geodia barretti TaxID=519541 RepID=A0AA35SLD3_GEOBA|nr:NEDD4-binding protein 2-like 2 [Geodia barretti]
MVTSIHAGSDGGKVKEFDSAVDEIISLGQEDTTCAALTEASQVPIVIALRGVPGSGKSFLTTHCSEYLTDSASVAICSADFYFMKGGDYKYSTKLLPMAHTYCLDLFLRALAEGKQLIVVDNTHSRKWEYEIYSYISSILGCRYHVLEIPCPSQKTLESYRSRNQHKIDEKTALNIFKRWEVDETTLLVPPSLAYPRMISNTPPVYSLVSLCSPDALDSSEALAQSTTLKAVYTAVFLTPESQWRLVSAVAPTHPRISADHVTLVFEPSKESCLNANIGSRVSLCVTGTADNGQVQVAAVELPRGLTCQNAVPHITVSAGENVPFKAANELLERQSPKPVYQNTELEGIIGIAVREKNVFDEPTECNSEPSAKALSEEEHYTAQQIFTIKSGMLFRGQIVPKLAAAADDTDIDTVEICTGEQKATRLYLFDFDDTLFSTPDARTGRQLYENFTGRKWKRKGWFTWPESLLPPLRAAPGPVLASFRDHIGQAGSITAILTGRNERTKPGVDHVLECYGVYPEKLIMKPDDTDEDTPVFKARFVQQLLNERPNITLVKFWDDNTRNLAAIHRLSLSSAFKHIQFDIVDATKMIQTAATKQGKKVKVQAQYSKKILGVDSYPSTLESYLASCGYLSSPAYKSSADCGIRFIAEQFSKLVGYTGNPVHLVYPFGSFPLGRRGDVDLCLLCPPHLTPADALEQLSRALGECGITYLHKGYSTRCPRLKLMLKFTAAPPIDYGIVFASISDPAHFESPQTLQLPAPKVLSKIRPEGINEVMPVSRFGGVVEMTVQMLIAQRQKGNAYHCIRTFHIVKLLATFIELHRDTLAEKNSDMIFKEFAVYVTKLPDETWKKLFGEFVPYEFIPKVQKVFKRATELMSSEQGGLCYQELMDRSAIYPPEGYTLVEIKLSGSNKIALWRLHAIVEARFPSYARQLISQGLDILPDGNVENKTKFVFAIMHTKATKQTLQQVLRPFWNEISRFKSEEGVNISLTFGRTAENSSSSEKSHQEQPKESIPAIKELTKFVSDSTQFEMMISCSLTSYERMLVHEKCEQLDLNHSTIVVRKEKHILVKKN